jgi:hypothetical protein
MKKKLHNEELSNLYSGPNIIRMIKLRRMRWPGLVVPMGESRGVYRVWWGDLRERDHLEDPGFDGNITVKWIGKKCYVSGWTRSIWLGQGQVAGTCNAEMNLQVPYNAGNFLTS